MAAIHYLKRNEINDDLWNACINTAANGLIYAYTFYLDAFCTAWDALVLDDYKAVMPLPVRKKIGIHYLYQPFAIAQSGLFGNQLTPELLHVFLKNMPSKFRYWDLPLNFNNRFALPPFPLYERKNYILKLDQPYSTIRSNYRPHIKRSLQKAVAKKLVLQKDIAVDAVIDLAKKHAANKGSANDYKHFKNVFALLEKEKKALTYGVLSATGMLLASAVFFFSHNRAYYILPGNHAEGRATGASPFLIDAFIKDHAAQSLVFDFEGSDVPGLQFFYTSFGAVEEPYAAIRYNRLPWLIRWLKK